MKTYSTLIGIEIKLNSAFKFFPKFILFSLSTMSFTYFGQTTYYLNALNGNDTLNGLSTSTPWQTIDKINTVHTINIVHTVENVNTLHTVDTIKAVHTVIIVNICKM